MFLIAWDFSFSFHSGFFHSNGGINIDDKRLKLSALMAIGCWVSLKREKENGTERICDIHILAYYIYTFSLLFLYKSSLFRTDDVDVIYIYHKGVI